MFSKQQASMIRKCHTGYCHEETQNTDSRKTARTKPVNFFPSSGFCPKLISFANSLNPDQPEQNAGLTVNLERICENFIFVNSSKRHIFHFKKSRLGLDIPTSVEDTVILPYL